MNSKVDGMRNDICSSFIIFCIYSLWKDVTYCLKSKLLDKATEAKSLLEQRQREGAKERAEKSIKWQTKVNANKK